MAMQWNVKCDGCAKTNLVHFRYKCLRCVNYDLCSDCFEKKIQTGSHSKYHPFQCLLDRAARELYFDGEEIPELCADSFTCPICGKMGHAVKDLVKHVQSKHLSDRTPVVCPLCIAVPSAEAVQINNLVNHITIIHGTGILRIGGGCGSNNQVGQPHGRGISAGHGHTLGTDRHNLGQTAGHSHGRVNGFCTGAQGTRDLDSSASLDGDFYSHSPWLADESSLSGSMHTMRDAEIDLTNVSEVVRQEFPEIATLSPNPNPNSNPNPSEAPLSSEDVYSEMDPDDFAADDARIEEYI